MFESIQRLYSWITSQLSSKEAKLLLLGLDNAGKTTLLRMMVDQRVTAEDPTGQPQCQKIQIQNFVFKTYDLGGHETVRKLWSQFVPVVNGIIFIVDISDETRYEEARIELSYLLQDSQLVNTPIVVLGNKIDKLQGGADENKLEKCLGLTNFRYGLEVDPSNIEHIAEPGKEADPEAPLRIRTKDGRRPVELFLCSIAFGAGYSNAFDWLIKFF